MFLLVGCKMSEQPPETISEKKMIEVINKKGNYFLVKRYFSEDYLRYKKEGNYSLQILSNDSILLKRVELESESIAMFIDTIILKDNKLISEINLSLIYQPKDESYQHAKYLTFSRSKIGVTKDDE